MKSKVHLKIIALFSYLIPRRFRSDWAEEWTSELQYRESRKGDDLIRPSLGAFWDALAMQSRRLEEDFWQDVRYGMRTFWSSKSVLAAVVLSLALGIGVNAALFSLVDAVLLRKLPVKDPDQLVLFQWVSIKSEKSLLRAQKLETRARESGATTTQDSVFSYLAFVRVKDRSSELADVFAFARMGDSAHVVVDGEAELVSGQWVSGGYFDGLGIGASAGRTIVESDDRPTSAPVAMLSDKYWSGRFDRNPNVLGKVISVGGALFTIAGVTPPGFQGTLQVEDAPDIYLPISFEPLIDRSDPWLNTPDNWWVVVMARPKAGASLARLKQEFEPIFQQAARDGYRESLRARRMFTRIPLREHQAPELRIVSGSQGLNDGRQTYETSLMVLTALAGLVLLIACVNVANLLLSRAATRQHEMAVRFALGAGRLRVVRQLLTESLLLAVIGGVGGLIVAYFAVGLFLQWGPWNSFGTGVSASLDVRVFVFTVGLSLMTSIVSGLVPAVVVTRRGLNAAMKETAVSASRRSYSSKVLLVGQAAMSVALLIGAGLFVTTVYNLRHVVIASDPGHVLQFTVDTSLIGYDRKHTVLLWDQMLGRIKAVPGVKAATIASGYEMLQGFGAPNEDKGASIVFVGPGFFETMGVPLVEGRGLSQGDITGPRRVVVNEAFAGKYFPAGGSIGKNIDGEIVGVARDADYLQFPHFSEFRKNVWPTMYALYQQPIPGPSLHRMVFQIRTDRDPLDLVRSIRVAVHEVDPQIALSGAGTLAERIDSAIATENTFARLSTLFGGIALLLTSIGLFGMLSYNVARRTKEFGIRLGLGSRPSHIVAVVLMDGLTLLAIGVAIGVAGAFAASRYIASILFGLKSSDPRVMAVSIAVVIVVGVLASWAPARRASRVQPLDALRYE